MRSPTDSPRLDRAAATILIVALFIATAAHLRWMLGVAVGVDEAWSVVVIRRLMAGERLYTDVFVGTTPLAFQIQGMAALLWENSILAMRAISHAFAAAAILATWAASVSLKVRPAWRAVLLAAAAAWFAPMADSLYSLLSALWITIVLLSVSNLSSLRSQRWLLLGSVACGLSIATKQNVGVLTTLAFGTSLVVLRTPLDRKALWRMAIGIGVAPLLSLLPTMLHGGTSDFLRFTLANKVTYLARAGMAYDTFINLTPLGEIRSLGVLDGLHEWGASLPHLLPGLLLVLVLIGVLKRTIDRQQCAILLVTGAAMASTYPRPDLAHLQIAIPALLLSTVVFLDRLVIPRRGVQLCLTAGALGAVLLTCAWRIQAADRSPPAIESGIPELTGLRFTPQVRDSLQRIRTDVRAGTTGEATMLLHPSAAVLYLISGARNPTPYDYPFITPFGPRGQQQVIAAIEAGTITHVCLYNAPWPMMEPTLLTAAVPRLMRRTRQGVVCDMFVRETVGMDR